MQLGKFSVSLAVQDLARSKAFYETLGFAQIDGDPAQGWCIMHNPDKVTIGLFQGMFDKNILTFNPGWDSTGAPRAEFTDIRALQKTLIDAGITIPTPVDETTTGPASFTIEDPDGNTILIDQHV